MYPTIKLHKQTKKARIIELYKKTKKARNTYLCSLKSMKKRYLIESVVTEILRYRYQILPFLSSGGLAESFGTTMISHV